ncbi:unnamed protein product [Phytophthora lilii]|uniref:Unnamed protein product n=1 Tax=Phytophthora lilii TaxID=2077276 RepID=A0A9W7CHY0_9STRA|nr:unnamed protein product [Phytophthora lilii]
MKELVEETPAPHAQMYMQMQPDWTATDASCWLDVYARRVQVAAPETQDSAQQQRATAVVHSSCSSQYQLQLSEASSTLEMPHLVQILGRGDSWINVQVEVKTSETPGRQLRTVFQAAHETVDVPVAEDQKMPSSGLLQLHAVDVSRDERFVVVGGSDGACMLWDSQNRAQMLPLKGHVADVTSVRFFPSSQVVLTGSLDFTLRVWSVQGRCAAVLKGHRGGVEDVAIVGRGRNVLYVVAKWANDDHSPVHCLSVMDDTAELLAEGDYPPNTNENEAETDGKVLFAGLDNGETLGVDVRARGAVICSTISCTHIIMCCRMPLHALSRSSSPIHSIAVSAPSADDPASIGGVWTAHGDGACCNWTNLGEAPRVLTELTGPEFDAVRGVAVSSKTGRVFSACRDGRLREYIPHAIA